VAITNDNPYEESEFVFKPIGTLHMLITFIKPMFGVMGTWSRWSCTGFELLLVRFTWFCKPWCCSETRLLLLFYEWSHLFGQLPGTPRTRLSYLSFYYIIVSYWN